MNELVLIDGIAVDLRGILSLAHHCDPTLCRDRESCCAHYEICCDEEEIPRLIGLFPQAARHAPHLLGADGYDNVFEETDDGLLCLDAVDDGLCILAYRDGTGRALCSLHSAALELGLDYFTAKPRACLLWPLALTNDDPPCLGVHPDALEFPCNHARKPGNADFDPGVAEIVRGLFGEDFYARLCAACYSGAVKST